MREPIPLPSRILFIADASLAADLAAQVASAVAAGATFIEIRRLRPANGTPDSALRLDEIRRCLVAAGKARVIVNDRVDLAVLADAAGAHVGQDDLPVAAARRLLGPHRLLGLSTHDEAQFAAAQDLPVDYVALGPIFRSSTKSGHAEPIGLERLAACVATSRLPIIAIGGIDADRLPGVLDAGARCAAVASAISSGPVGERTRALLDIVAAHRPLAPRERGQECLVLTGPPGAGKSRVGVLVARGLRLPFTDLDEAVGGVEGVANRLARIGETAFRDVEARALRALLEGPPQVLALGGGTLLAEWPRLALRQAGARVVALDVDPAECLRRLGKDRGRPLLEAARALGSGAAEAHLRLRLEAARAFPTARVVDGTGTPEAVAERVIQALTE